MYNRLIMVVLRLTRQREIPGEQMGFFPGIRREYSREEEETFIRGKRVRDDIFTSPGYITNSK